MDKREAVPRVGSNARAEKAKQASEEKFSSKSGWSNLLSGANGVRSIALAGGVALHAVNVYIATTILPTVVHDIGGLDLYAWNTTIFVVASILGSALSTRLLQLTGPRNAYIFSTVVFAAGAVVCAVAATMPLMLIGRLIQGIGGGLLFALAYAMIRIVFDEALWPRAMALVSGMWGVATLVGPLVGGIFAELGVWRAAFWSVTLVAALFASLATAVLPRRDGHSAQSQGTPAPFHQLLLLTCTIIAVSAGSASSDLTQNILGIAIALVLAMLLIATETHSRRKLLPSDAFRPSSAIASLYSVMSLLVVMVTSGEVFVPLFLQVLHHQSPLIAGYLAALMAAGWTLGSITSSGATGRVIGHAIMAGPVLGLVGMVGLDALVPRNSNGTWLELAPICLALVAIGFGVGLAWPHLLTSVLKAAPPHEQELAGASITTIQLFATATGAALAGMVANAGGLIDPGGLVGTANAARWLFGIFALAPLFGVVVARRCCH